MRTALALLVAWLVLTVAGGALALATPRAALRAVALAPFVRASVCAEEQVALIAVVIAAGVPLVALGRARPRAARLLAIALLALLTLAWTASWESFRAAGRFTDGATLRFGAVGGWQLAAHASHLDPWLAVRVPALAFLLTLAMAVGARSADRMSLRAARATALALGIGPVASIVLALAGPRADPAHPAPLADPDAGMVYTDVDLEATLRADRTGPLAALLAPWRARRAEEAPPAHVDPALPVTWSPIRSIDDWAREASGNAPAGPGGHAARAAGDRPNVLLVVIESLRRDQLVCCGGRRVVMPALEALAARGTVFTNALACAPHSNYADPALLSGLYPLRAPRTHVYAPNDPYPRVLLHDLLGAVGYRTAIVSSQDERWGGMLDFLATPQLSHLFHAGNYDGPTYVPREDAGFAAFARGERRSGKIDDRYTVAEAQRWIDADAPPSRPFLLYLNLQNSHLPYEVPADFTRRFARGSPDFPITFGGYPPERASEVRDHYADSLAYVDAMLARLLDHLAATGLDHRTIVIATGDTGQSFGDKGVFAHAGPLFDEQLAVPLIVAGPGLRTARDAREALHLDIPPTVLELLGLPPHPSFQGASLAGPTPRGVRHRYLVVQSPLAHQYGVARGAMKLVYDARAGRAILFDHNRDPAETRDATADHPEAARELAARLDTWRARQLEYYANPGQYTRLHPPRHGD